MSFDNATNDPMNFVKNMWGNMGFSLPGMVTPTFDVEEIEKRVKDMKAVEGWLKMNLSMLQMTIQSLEMQCSTLNAVKTMGKMASAASGQSTPAPEAAPAFSFMPPPATSEGTEAPGAASMWPWTLMQQMQEQMQQAQQAAAEQTAASEAAKAAPKRSKKSQ